MIGTPPHAGARPVQRVLFACAVLIIACVWVNSRISTMRVNGPKPIVLSAYYIYHGMAQALREGRVGQFDITALRRYIALNDPDAPYGRVAEPQARDWRTFYSLDIGYLFIVEAARLAFPSLPDNILRSLALQLFVDALMPAMVFFVFRRWHPVLGLVAAALYARNAVFAVLASFAYYYYWDIPLAFAVLWLLLLAYRAPESAVWWLSVAAALLGFGTWVRGTWWALAFVLFLVTVLSRRLRPALVVPIVVFAVVSSPQVIRSTYARGHLALSTRATWHVAIVGLGYLPNRYGFEPKDEAVFALTKRKYGVEFRAEDYYVHDQAARQEFMSILRQDPGFVARSFWARLRDSVAGSTPTSVLTYISLSNVLYRLLCVLGCLVMVLKGGELRFLAAAAAAMYATYVVVTSLFYFVGLAYDNVSEVAMFVVFMGLIKVVFDLAQQRLSALSVVRA